MESAEAILENENNSNVESESHNRRQLSNQNANVGDGDVNSNSSHTNLESCSLNSSTSDSSCPVANVKESCGADSDSLLKTSQGNIQAATENNTGNDKTDKEDGSNSESNVERLQAEGEDESRGENDVRREGIEADNELRSESGDRKGEDDLRDDSGIRKEEVMGEDESRDKSDNRKEGEDDLRDDSGIRKEEVMGEDESSDDGGIRKEEAMAEDGSKDESDNRKKGEDDLRDDGVIRLEEEAMKEDESDIRKEETKGKDEIKEEDDIRREETEGEGELKDEHGIGEVDIEEGNELRGDNDTGEEKGKSNVEGDQMSADFVDDLNLDQQFEDRDDVFISGSSQNEKIDEYESPPEIPDMSRAVEEKEKPNLIDSRESAKGDASCDGNEIAVQSNEHNVSVEEDDDASQQILDAQEKDEFEDLPPKTDKYFETNEIEKGIDDCYDDDSEPPDLTKEPASETFLHFSALGDDDLVSESESTSQPITSEEKAPSLSNEVKEQELSDEGKVKEDKDQSLPDNENDHKEILSISKEQHVDVEKSESKEMEWNVEEDLGPEIKDNHIISQDDENLLLSNVTSLKDGKEEKERKADSQMDVDFEDVRDVSTIASSDDDNKQHQPVEQHESAHMEEEEGPLENISGQTLDAGSPMEGSKTEKDVHFERDSVALKSEDLHPSEKDGKDSKAIPNKTEVLCVEQATEISKQDENNETSERLADNSAIQGVPPVEVNVTDEHDLKKTSNEACSSEETVNGPLEETATEVSVSQNHSVGKGSESDTRDLSGSGQDSNKDVYVAIKKEVDIDSYPVEELKDTASQPASEIVKREILQDSDHGGEPDIVILDDDDSTKPVSVKTEGHNEKESVENGMGIQIAAVSGQEDKLHAEAFGLNKKAGEESSQAEKWSSKSKTQKCIVCDKVTKCKFNIVRGGDTKHLCDDVCFKKFRKNPTSFLTKPQELRTLLTAPQSPQQPQQVTRFAPIQPKPPLLPPLSPAAPAKSETSSEPYKTCCVCHVIHLRTSQTFCNWKGFDFCGEICLGKFQAMMKTYCYQCTTYIPLETRYSHCEKVGNAMLAFCKINCLEDFMKKLKTCAFCKQDLSSFVPVNAVVGSNKKKKEFCSKDCVRKLEDQLNDVEIVHMETNEDSVDYCSVCNTQMTTAHCCVRFQSKTFKLCSDICLVAFQYTNKINLNKCESCGFMCTPNISQARLIQFEGVSKYFCSDLCIESFRGKNRKLVPCTWCATQKANFDMIERQDENKKYQMFCSLNCLSLFRVNLQAKSNQAVECDRCKKIVPAQYHLTMSDASVRNFCSYICVMAFQSQFNNRITPPNSSASSGIAQKSGQQAVVKPPVPPPSTPLQPEVPALPYGTRNRGKKIPPTKGWSTPSPQPTPPSTPPSLPVISSVVSLAPDDVLPNNISAQKLQEKTTNILLRNLEKKSVLVTGDGKQRIVVETSLPKVVKNKSIQCKPSSQTKATACRPHSQPKECQTDDSLGKPVIVPIPVPIYIPMPTVMYSAPTPVFIPIPIPIPVPIFIPTTRKSANGILKSIKEIQERMPADPLEAEMLMMAEAVATDGKVTAGDSDTDSELDDFDHATEEAELPVKPANTSAPSREKGGGAEDMIQMALRMAEEMSGPVEDLEASLQPVAVSSASGSQRAVEPPAVPSPHVAQQEDPDYTPVKSGRGRGSKRASRGRPPANSRPKRQRTGRSYVEPEVEPQEQPVPVEIAPPLDNNYKLKFTYGVNGWKHWVIIKNAELEKSSPKNSKVRLFPSDVLKCTIDELHYSLCLFIKEVRKPNGEPYSADSIYYLCLGIQQYLYENGRIDNIFTDLYFQRFTDSLHEILKSLQPKVNSQGQMLCRIEEEHLWESKQLGAHSPYVLLNTLIYFHTKHFILKTAADHMSLSFAQILKHWKKGVPGKAGVPATNVPKNASLRFYCLANKKQDNAVMKKGKEGGVPVYEVTENFDSPLRCPVKLYEFFLSKCPESIKNRNDIFYPIPERSCVPDSPVWYSTQSIEHHTMDKMLTRVLLVREIQEAHLHAQPTYIKM